MSGSRWAAGLAILALTGTACGIGGGDVGAENGGHLVYAEQFAPASQWALESDDAHLLMRAGCLETLLRYETDGTLSPALATAWERVARTEWRFTLRKGVEFQDGTPLDADAVAGALTHVLRASEPARALNPAVVKRVKATDDATVQITTARPDTLLPLRLASPNSGILAPRAFEADATDIEGTCTGPFAVVDSESRRSLSLERHDAYWGGVPTLDSVEVRFVKDGDARATRLQGGEVHIAKSLPASSAARVDDAPGTEVREVPLPRTTVMLLNNSRPPFDDPLVREAVRNAVDQAAIIDTVYDGVGRPAVGPFAPDSPWAQIGPTPPSFDPRLASSLLSQAGVDPEKLRFQLVAYDDRPEFAELAAEIKQQLAALGVTVRVRSAAYAAVEPDLIEGTFDAALLSRGYLVDVADPAGYLRSDFMCGGAYNLARYCDRDTDAMIAYAAAREDMQERNAAYGMVAQKLQSEAASFFLLHESGIWGYSKQVSNFDPHPLDYYVVTANLALRAE